MWEHTPLLDPLENLNQRLALRNYLADFQSRNAGAFERLNEPV